MKKKLFSVLLVGALAASLVACDSKKKEADKTPSTVNSEINADEYAATITDNAGIYKTFVSLSDWKGMSVDLAESDYKVTDSDVEDYIKSMLESKATTNVMPRQQVLQSQVIQLSLIIAESLTEQHFQVEQQQMLLTQLVQVNLSMILIKDLLDLQLV